MDGAPLRGLRG